MNSRNDDLSEEEFTKLLDDLTVEPSEFDKYLQNIRESFAKIKFTKN